MSTGWSWLLVISVVAAFCLLVSGMIVWIDQLLERRHIRRLMLRRNIRRLESSLGWVVDEVDLIDPEMSPGKPGPPLPPPSAPHIYVEKGGFGGGHVTKRPPSGPAGVRAPSATAIAERRLGSRVTGPEHPYDQETA